MSPPEFPIPNNPNDNFFGAQDTVTFPPGGPYAAAYAVPRNGLPHRPGKPGIGLIVLEVSKNDPAGIGTFTKTAGPCADPESVAPGATISVPFPVPDTTVDVCEWKDQFADGVPLLKVVVRTKRV